MIILGITGGIGSGKSTVCSMLAKRGARIFNADEVAKDLMVTDDDIRLQVLEVFGSAAYAPDGSLNRRFLARRIFSSKEERKQLEAIVHPAVARAFEETARNAESDGVSLLVKEAALLLETDTSKLSSILVVHAPEGDRMSRVSERDGATKTEVLARMNQQMSTADMLKHGDFVIRNDGTLYTLRRDVNELYDTLVG